MRLKNNIMETYMEKIFPILENEEMKASPDITESH